MNHNDKLNWILEIIYQNKRDADLINTLFSVLGGEEE